MKGSSSTWHLYCFLLVLALGSRLSNSSPYIIGHKYFVRIVNNLSDHDILYYDCRSDAGDVMENEIAPNQQREWRFRATSGVYGGTVWSCKTWYQSSSGGLKGDAFFRAFSKHDIHSYGGVHAIWSARDTGMWLCNTDTGEYTLKSPWSHE